jgi:hypothetical protein
MAIEKGITEIDDSEDEPMTSSPVAVLDEAARDKLSALASVPPQERQDALSEADGTHQALAQGIANAASDQAEALDVDRSDPAVDVHALHVDQTDLKLDETTTAQQEGATVEVGNNHQEEQAQSHSPQESLGADDMPTEDRVTLMQAPPMNAAQHDREVLAQHGGIDHRSSEKNANRVTNEAFLEPSNPTAADGRLADASVDPTADHQEQQSMSEALTEGDSVGQAFGEQAPTEMEPVGQSQDDEQNAADAPSESPSTVKHKLLASKSDLHEIPDQPQDVVMSHGSPPMQAHDDDRTSGLNMELDHPNEHAVCLKRTYFSRLSAHIPQDSIPEVTAATALKSAELEDEVAHHKEAPISDVAAQGAAAVTVGQEDPHSSEERSEAKGILNSLYDTNMDVEASPSVSQFEDHPTKSEERYAAADETLQTKESERQGPDAAPDPPPAESTLQLHPNLPAQHSPVNIRPAPPRTPQEITLAELKAQKAALLASLGALPAIQVLIEESASSDTDMDDGDGAPTDSDITAAANKIVKEHIKLLHEYNELKDVGQGLMGLIADQRGVRIVEVQEEFGIDAKD